MAYFSEVERAKQFAEGLKKAKAVPDITENVSVEGLDMVPAKIKEAKIRDLRANPKEYIGEKWKIVDGSGTTMFYLTPNIQDIYGTTETDLPENFAENFLYMVERVEENNSILKDVSSR